jgi:hypothetical protein
MALVVTVAGAPGMLGGVQAIERLLIEFVLEFALLKLSTIRATVFHHFYHLFRNVDVALGYMQIE